MVELDKKKKPAVNTLHLFESLHTLESRNESFHPVKSCRVFLYSGFVVLTLLQVVSLVRVIGLLSQALRLSNLKLLLIWRIIVCGQDMILFNYVILRIHCVEYSFKLCFISAAKLYSEQICNNSLTLLFCFRSVCYGCMNPTTYVWVTCRDPCTCGLLGSYGMPDTLLF